MTEIVSVPFHGSRLVNEEGKATDALQLYLDDITQKLNEVVGDRVTMPSYTVATVPDATTAVGWILVTDEAIGSIPAFNDGTVWRRCTDRAAIST